MGSHQDGKGGISTYSVLYNILYVLLFLGAFSFMLSTITLLPTPIGIVTSRSMEPLLTVGDVVFIQPAAIEDLKVGDVIAYHSPPDKMIIHRVVKVLRLPGKVYLITKGDANPVTDQSIGFPPVKAENLIGKVFCLDGVPFKVPHIGVYIIQARNFAIWLTQNKIWSFWGPLIAIVYVFGPYFSPKGISQLDLRSALRSRIPVKTLLIYALVSFVAISAFTFYFKVESYTLSMRVACLLEDKEPAYISFGSMIYGEVKNNTIQVTGAPLFPVKTVAMLFGNASTLVRPIPDVMIVEPQTLTTLTLQAKIPPRGEVKPGIYRANVYIFSDTLLLILPNNLIFSTFYALGNPWISLALLDFLSAAILASSIAVVAITINYASSQILYTIIWRDKLDTTPPHKLRVKMYKFRRRLLKALRRIEDKLLREYSTLKESVDLRRVIKPSCIAAVPSVALFLATDNLILPALTLSTSLGLAVWRARFKGRSEMLTSAAVANLALTAAFILRRSMIPLYSKIDPIWCVVSAGFVGNISYVVTIPMVAIMVFCSFIGLHWFRVWYLEQQTSGWRSIKRGVIKLERTIHIPRLGELRRARRRLTVEFKQAPSRLEATLNNLGGYIHSFAMEARNAMRRLKLEGYTAALRLKALETRLINLEVPLLVSVERLRSDIESLWRFLAELVREAFWSLRLLRLMVALSVYGR